MSEGPPPGPPDEPPAPEPPPPSIPAPSEAAYSPAPWGFKGAALVTLLALASQVMLALVLGGVARLILVRLEPNIANHPDELLSLTTQTIVLPLEISWALLTLGLVYASVTLRHRRPFLGALRLLRPTLNGLFASAGGGFALAMLGVLLMSLFPWRGDDESLGPLSKLASSGGLGAAIWMLLAVGIAPVIEEILFRGYAYLGARERIGAFWAGVLVTAVFVPLHVGETGRYWPALVGITTMSAALVVVMERTRNLTYCIICHLGYNAGLVSLSLLSTG